MRVDSLDLRHVRLPLRFPFETSFGRVEHHDAVLVRIVLDGVEGWGECPTGAAPRYSAETVATVLHVARDFLAPLLRAAPIDGYFDVPRRFAPVRGHPMAKAGIEMAVADAFGRAAGLPLSRLYGGTRREIPTGVSLGIEPSIEALASRVDEFAGFGYQRVKVKIKPGWDLKVIEELRRRFPRLPLSVDANAAYSLTDPGHVRTLETLDGAGLMMIEQPLAETDLVDHAALQRRLATPLCLDESIPDDAACAAAVALGSCRIVNIKQARVGGPTAAQAIHDRCAAAGIPVWCGGLLETGIGRAHNIALATLPNFSLPGDISGSDRYFAEDLIDPPVAVRPDGTIAAPTAPGLGHTVRLDRIDRATVTVVPA